MNDHTQHIFRRLFLLAFGLLLAACTQRATPTPSTPTAAPTATATATPKPSPSPTTEPFPMIVLSNADDLTQVEEISQPEANFFTWLPGLDSIALANEEAVFLYRAGPDTTAQLAPAIPIETGDPTRLAVSPDGEALAVATLEDRIRLYDLETGEPTHDLEPPGTITGLSFSPMGEELAVTTSDGLAQVWDAAGGEVLQEFEHPGLLTNPDFSPDGDRLAGTDPANFAVPIFDLETGEREQILRWMETASPALYGASFSPDWEQLAWVARGTVQLMAVESGVFGPTLEHEDFVNDVAWSPDGEILAVSTAATVDGELQPAIVLWEAATGEQITVLAQPQPVLSLSFSPDGRSLAALLFGGELQIWAVSR